MRSIKIYLLLSLFLFSFKNLQGGWLDRKAEGWFWYEDQKKREEEKEIEQPKESPQTMITMPSSAPPPISATEEMALIRKELEERLNRAIINPSEENVFAYMQMQQLWINQSTQFSEAWLRNLLNHPNLDSRLDEPITQYGAQVHKQIMREKREGIIRSLVDSHGLFFFYEGNNKISQAFSFVAKEFAKKYGWPVFAISCDGVFIKGFDHNQVDQGIIERLGIDNFPSLYLIEPNKHTVVPIAFGLSSVDQIEENIDIQLNSRSVR